MGATPIHGELTTRSNMGRRPVISSLKKLFVFFTLGFLFAASSGVRAQNPAGSQEEEVRENPPLLSNRPPVEILPFPPSPTDKPTFADPQGRLEVIIDAEHGYLKSLRFPGLFAGASAHSIDRYIILDGLGSSELDDEVINIQRLNDAAVPHVIVDCLNRTLAIAIRKIYQFDPAHDEVIKTVEIESTAEKLMTVVSVSVLSEATRKGGYYYQYLTHTHGRLLAFPTSSIGDAYFPNRRNFQSSVMTVTRPDIDFTYGEVPLFTNGVGEYPAVQSDGYLPVTANVETLMTKDGWQLPRGNWLQVGPGRGAQRVSWLYSATRGTHLMWHANYHKRYFFPAFAPERPLARAIDVACDVGHLYQSKTGIYRDGTLKLTDGKTLAHFEEVNKMLEGLGPRAWGACLLSETTYTMGDYLSDNFYFSAKYPPRGEDVEPISTKEYLKYIRSLQDRLPRFHFCNYERSGYYGRTETVKNHPELVFQWDGPHSNWSDTEKIGHPWRAPFFELMTGKYLEMQQEGLSLYVDHGLSAADAGVRPDGTMVFDSYEAGQKAMKKMARAMRDAGGMFWVNQPSGTWADFGYIELSGWDSDTREDWRLVGDKLQIYKMLEFRPNTIIPLYPKCIEYIHQCLAYNFLPNCPVPSPRGRFEAHAPPGRSNQSQVMTKELVRLRWYLREAKMAPVPLRPVAWEEPGSPLETTVMTLPGTVYLAAINHIDEDYTADLSVDLGPLMGQRPYALWRADVIQGPWVGINCPPGWRPSTWWRKTMKDQGIEVEPGAETPKEYDWKDEPAEVTYGPAANARWDGLRLTLADVEIPRMQSTYFFLSTVPVVVRSVEGKDVPWPVSSQPHIHIKSHPDGTLLVDNEYTGVVLAVHPDWLAKDAKVGAPDAKTGWPTIAVRPGTWRLKPDGRLLYESHLGDAQALVEVSPDAALPPLVTGGPVGIERLGTQKKVVLQNGVDGYRGQTNEEMTTGQWGGAAGCDSHGSVNGPDVMFIYADGAASRHARDLIRFDLEGCVANEAKVARAILVIHCNGGINGTSILAGYKVLKPWTDGTTCWMNWGKGGDEPGYIESAAVLTGYIAEERDYYFRVASSVVEDWLERPETNHGLLLKSIRDSNGFHWGADGDTGDEPPKLIIEYDTP